MLVGDFARVVDGKLDVLGAGWAYAGPDPVSMGIGVIIDVPWDQTNTRHELSLRLLGEDGEPAQLPAPQGQPAGTIELQTEFEVGRPPGAAAGASMPFAMGLNIAGVPLPPGRRYEWRLAIDSETQDDWYVGFQMLGARPAPTGPASW